ncbi:MAG: hypothetical protein HN478_01835 [Rhodospirillaceae bacterium]|jgi:hypothetical protein|nr:hypothetical protein [Rhodospirillaceae bacterium]MBT4489230.1 hypothetical protein [Rhodospirillaceae bacterium]MBT5194233.1 hypothetical protein [Rhodospirillaceae bacterium]MBT5897651.1 hypothetical protein [Rhodospirillaceae bacterium]MBT6431099.1 hypothetical protein [Rhodospirillaceae bacterium]
MTGWTDLKAELDRWAGDGQRAGLWWRDDDATAPGPRLQRLTALSEASGVPLALAVIPARAENALGGMVAGVPGLKMLVHGLRHQNNAPAEEKKAEFGAHRPVSEMLGDAAIGYENLLGRFADLTLPVFVPPWNRIDEQLVTRLPLARLTGLSRYGQRRAKPPGAGPLENNCHLDLIDWRGGRGFIGRDAALDLLINHLRARRTGSAARDEATGVLSHHGVMDEETWDFLAELFACGKESDGAHWLTIDEVFRVPE